MGLFTSLLKTETKPSGYVPKSIQEAYWAVLHTVANIDDEVAEDTNSNLTASVLKTGLFGDVDISQIYLSVHYGVESYGAKNVIEAGAKMIPEKYRPQLFCFCAEIVVADGLITFEEEQILEFLAKTIMVSDELAKKIVEVALIRNGM